MISYKIENNGLIRVVFQGTIVFKDIVDWLSEFSVISQLPQDVKLLYDMRTASLRVDMVKLIQITKKTDEVTSKYESVRTAFLIEEAELSTFTMLLSFLDVEGKTVRKLFTNYEKAMGWLGSGNA